MVSDAMLSLEDCFQVVDDPRVVPRCTHSLHTLLFIAVAATIAGAEGPEDMAKFAKRKTQGLKQFVTTLLKQDTSKSSLKQKRKEAVWTPISSKPSCFSKILMRWPCHHQTPVTT